MGWFFVGFLGYPLMNELLKTMPVLAEISNRNHVRRNRIISLVHSVAVTSVAGWVTFATNTHEKGLALLPIRAIPALLLFEAGYLSQDTLAELHSYCTVGKWGGKPIFLHHVAILTALAGYFLFFRYGDYYIGNLLCMSFSNIFLHGGYLAKEFSGSRSCISRFFTTLLPPSFALSRFGIFPWMLSVYARQINSTLPWWQAFSHLKWYCQTGTFLFCVFNLWLAFQVTQKRPSRSSPLPSNPF